LSKEEEEEEEEVEEEEEECSTASCWRFTYAIFLIPHNDRTMLTFYSLLVT
jgi:hypothetical protein